MAGALLSIPLEISLEKVAEALGQQISLVANAPRNLQRIRRKFQSIKAVLRDAESKQIAEESVRVWLSNIKAVALDLEDVLDEWQITVVEKHKSSSSRHDDELGKVSKFFPSPHAYFDRSASRFKISRQVKEIGERLDEIEAEKDHFNFRTNNNSDGETMMSVRRQRETSSHMTEDVSEIVGREADREMVMSRLVSERSSHGGDADRDGLQKVVVTAIVGIGGLGKTTLAQQIYNDGKMQDHFKGSLYWVCVSEPFDVIRIVKTILAKIEGPLNASLDKIGRRPGASMDLDGLQTELRKSLERKRFLLVLDDVWNDDADRWNLLRIALDSGLPGSRILVTTRSLNVAKVMNSSYVHQLRGLSDDVSWTLFSRRAFAGRKPEECSEFESVGKKIAKKCSGVPLSLKVMGAAMNSKTSMADWQNISDSEMWSLPEVEDKILPALLLSYYDLPPHLKQCFAYCSVYQKDTEMKKDVLIKLWVAQGFIQRQGNREMEDIAEEYLNDLLGRSMLQAVEKDDTCQMHDLLHDLAEFITKDETYIFSSGKSNQCSTDVRHASSFLNTFHPRISTALRPLKKLRSLLVEVPEWYEIDTNFVDVFREERFLRVLVLRARTPIKKLPKTIGELKHLRYLDLSHLPIVKLPESVAHLVKLHTLNLYNCFVLRKLPREIGGMVSLRHLKLAETYSLERIPKGVNRLSSLRTLDKFIVGGKGGCMIDELRQLNSLQGSLTIENLEKISSREEAEKAELQNKPHLRRLILIMSSGSDDAEKEEVVDVLDGLRPHGNLEELSLYCRSNSKLKLPIWLEDWNFSKLTKLDIMGFSNCEENLLGLGKLPALKYLEIRDVGVRKMGDEFYYGIDSYEIIGESRAVAFPKLENLFLMNMRKLEVWELASEAYGRKAMPLLRELLIEGCPKLQGPPTHHTNSLLEKFTLAGSDRFF